MGLTCATFLALKAQIEHWQMQCGPDMAYKSLTGLDMDYNQCNVVQMLRGCHDVLDICPIKGEAFGVETAKCGPLMNCWCRLTLLSATTLATASQYG